MPLKNVISLESFRRSFYILNALFQGVCPVRDIQAEGPLDLRLVQDRIGRTLHRARELVAVARADVASGMTGILSCHLREVVPGTDPLVAVVVYAAPAVPNALAFVCGIMPPRFPFIVSQNSHDSPSQIVGVGRSASLVEYDIQMRLGRCKIQHCPDEVLPVFAVKPRRPDDHVVAPAFNYIVLPFKFGRPVHPRRGAFLFLPARSVVRVAPEHVVRGDVHQQAAGLFHRLRKDLRGVGIEPAAQGLLTFGLVHIGIGRAVHYAAYAVLIHRRGHPGRVSDVEYDGLLTICRNYVRKYVPVIRLTADNPHLVSELAVGPCH